MLNKNVPHIGNWSKMSPFYVFLPKITKNPIYRFTLLLLNLRNLLQKYRNDEASFFQLLLFVHLYVQSIKIKEKQRNKNIYGYMDPTYMDPRAWWWWLPLDLH